MNASNTELKLVLESLGFENVESVNSSGNILFSTYQTDIGNIESSIQNALLAKKNLVSLCIIRCRSEIVHLVNAAPFGDQKHSLSTYQTVTFLKHRIANHTFYASRLSNTDFIPIYLPKSNVFLAVFDNTLSKNPNFMSKLEREFGKEITTRTWNTIIKLYNRMSVE